jgi:hypothetical protein
MISHKISTTPKNSLLSQICHIGKRSFILANCGPAVYPSLNCPTNEQPLNVNPTIPQIKQNYPIREENPKINDADDNASFVPLKKKFKPNLDGCRSRLASESDEVKLNDVIQASENDITSELMHKLKADSLWKLDNDKLCPPKTCIRRKASTDSSVESAATDVSSYNS